MRQRLEKKTRRYVRCLIPCVLLVFLLFPVCSHATLVLDFGTGTAGNGGLITLIAAGSLLNATGSNIPVDVLTYTNTPSTPVGGVVYNLSGSGASNDADGSAVINFDTRTATNFFQVIGGVPALGIPAVDNTNTPTVLASGSFSTFQIIGPYGNYLSVFGSGTDQKSPALLSALNVNPNLSFTFFGFSMSSFYNPNTNSGLASSTNFSNTAVPIPPSAFLLATGLIGLVVIRRRRKN